MLPDLSCILACLSGRFINNAGFTLSGEPFHFDCVLLSVTAAAALMTAGIAEKRNAMNRFATTALALVLSACSANVYAATGPKGSTGSTGTTVVTTTTTTATKGKLIRFQLRNDSSSAMTLQVGDQQFTVQAGKTTDIKAAAGTQIIAVNGSGSVSAGTVVTTVNPILSGNTLAVN
jgi:hypothetical protein